MYKIAVIEDNPVDLDIIKKRLNDYFVSNGLKCDADFYGDPLSFLDKYKEEKYDAIFFDIELPGMSGIEAARKVRESDENIIIAFTTNMTQYALQAYDLNAIDYFVKPIKEASFFPKMDRILKEIMRNKNSKIVWLNTKTSKIKLLVKDIDYIESQSHLITWHVKGKEYESTGTLSVIEESLSSSGFIRVNSGTIVSIEKIQSLQGSEITIDSAKILVSRSKRKEVLSKIMLYYGGR